MKTELIAINPAKPEPGKIKYAAQALRNGRLVVFPTETVYGIGANAQNKKALTRLRKLKERPKNPFSFHIAAKSDLERLNCVVDKTAKKIIDRFWPGPLTLVLKTSKGEGAGVRMPAHPVALKLLREVGVGIVAPSANFKDDKPATTGKSAYKDLNGIVDIVIDSGKTKVGVSSTVLDLTKSPAKILREGSIGKREIEKIIGKITYS